MGYEAMKVALELQPCCGSRSGIGVYTYELSRRLCETEDLEFFGNIFDFRWKRGGCNALEGINLPLRSCRWFPYGVYRRIWRYVPISYDTLFRPQADLSVFFNYVVPPRIRGKTIVTIHDMTYLRYPETLDKRNLRRLLEGVGRSIEDSDQILTVSEFSKREIIELLQVPEERISVINSAASIPSEDIIPFQILSQKYGLTGPYLIYVGNIEPRKNLSKLLLAFDLLKKEQGIAHKLVIVGGAGWNNREIYQTLHSLSCVGDVLFFGYLPTPERDVLYQHAAALVFPSLYEGFGLPPLEAMQMSCPVVCSNAASLPEVVGDAAELFDPYDTVSIANGIWRVISDEGRRRSLIKKGILQSKKFSWEASAERLTDVCRKVLELPGEGKEI